jgi:hypothetical protein
MNLSLSEIAVAIGLLTPLVLGVLAFVDKRLPGHKTTKAEKREDANEDSVLQGLPVKVDFAAELVKELREDARQANERATKAEAERDAYKRLAEGR